MDIKKQKAFFRGHYTFVLCKVLDMGKDGDESFIYDDISVWYAMLNYLAIFLKISLIILATFCKESQNALSIIANT